MTAAAGLLLVSLACLGDAQRSGLDAAPAPVRWRSASALPLPVRAGKPFDAVVEAEIAPGWHLYALEQPEEGAPALDFAINGGPAVPVALLSVGAPRPQRGVTAGGGAAANFYVGRTAFRLHLRAGAEGWPGERQMVVSIRYVACNERICRPPQRAALPLALRVMQQ